MKYIVYKTTNLINNYIYIGVHKTKNPDVFDEYLGCGVFINRPRTYEKAKTAFQQAVKEFGPKNFKRETLAVFDIAEEAYALEGFLVNESFLARQDVYNMILGGIINPETGKLIYCYSAENGNFIKEYTSYAEATEDLQCGPATIANSIRYKFKVKGFIFSEIKTDCIDLSVYNFKTPVSVYRYLKTGEFDKEFNSMDSAGKNTLNTSTIYIQKAATLGYLVKDQYYFSFYRESSYDKARTLQIKNREVYCYDSEGRYLKSYAKQEDAEKENPYCNITKAIKLRKLDENNHYWALVKLKYYNKPVKRVSKKVAKFDADGNIIQCWDSSNQCAKEVGVAVKNVLRGEYTHHKGYVYKYIE